MQKFFSALAVLALVVTGCAVDAGAARERATAELRNADRAETARAAEELDDDESALAAEQARFQTRAVNRLDALSEKIAALRETAQTSKKPNSIIDEVITGTSALRDDVRVLREKLPAMVQVSSDATWTLTQHDLAAQIQALDDRFQALNDLI